MARLAVPTAASEVVLKAASLVVPALLGFCGGLDGILQAQNCLATEGYFHPHSATGV